MLILGSRNIGKPVMSLQTGSRLGIASRALFDPTNLTIAAYEVTGPLVHTRPTYLRVNEIREVGNIGIIIDSNDDLVELDDVIRIKQLHEIDFPLLDMPVIDESKRKLGKVSDYTIETGSFVVEQLHVRRGIIKGITETSLLINRSQVVKVTDNEIIVKTTAKKVVEPVTESRRHEYVNPFRQQPAPQTESASDAS